MTRTVHVALMILALTLTGNAAQSEGGIQALALDDGIALLWNEPNDHFLLELRGKRVVPIPADGRVFFDVDGAMVQVQSVPVSAFLPKGARPDELATLEAHRDWEAAFIRKALGESTQITSTKKTLPRTGLALAWGFDLPKNVSADASKQLYLVVLRKDRLILVSGSVTKRTTGDAVEKILSDTLSTLRVSDTPIDLTVVQESIRTTGRP